MLDCIVLITAIKYKVKSMVLHDLFAEDSKLCGAPPLFYE